MMAFPSVPNSELGFLFGNVRSVSSSRTQPFILRRFIFCTPNLQYGSWTNASFKSKVVPPALVTTTAAAITTTDKVKVVFLREQGYSSTLDRVTIKKPDPFIAHLVTRLSSLEKSGHELTATGIRDALTHESLSEQNGATNVADNFINPTVKEVNSVSPISPSNTASARRKLRALSMIDKRDPDGNLSPLVLYLFEFGFDLDQIKKMVWKYPALTSCSLEGKIKPLIGFLLGVGVSRSDIPTILVRWPSLWGYSMKEKIIPNVALLESLGVDKRRWPILLRRGGAAMFGLRRHNIEATVNFLIEMGVPSENIGKIIERSPCLIWSSIEYQLRPVCDYFRLLGVDVGHLLRYPTIFKLNIESKLKHVTQFFLENGFSEEELGLMISRFGCLYSYSLTNNLVPKWEYFLTMDYPKEHLVTFPLFFGFSLEKRIKPRYALVKEYGVDMSFSVMLSLSDLSFDKALNRKLDNNVSYKASRVPEGK